MKKFLHWLKNLFCFNLVFISLILINIYMLLLCASNLISKDNIVNTMKEIEIKDVIDPKTEVELYSTLNKAGISNEVVTSVIENEKIKESIGSYVADILESTLSDKEIPAISEDELSTILKESLNTIIKSENINLTEKQQEKIIESIDEYTPDIVVALEDVQEIVTGNMEDNTTDNEELNNFNEVIDFIKPLYQNKIFFLLGAIISIVLIIVLNLKELKFLKWLLFASIMYGFNFIFLGSIFTMFGGELLRLNEIMSKLIEPSFNLITKTYFNIGIISVIIAILIRIIMLVIKRKKQNESV